MFLLVPHIRGATLRFSSLSLMFVLGFLHRGFLPSSEGVPCSSFAEVFCYLERVLNFVKCFFSLSWYNHVCLFFSVACWYDILNIFSFLFFRHHLPYTLFHFYTPHLFPPPPTPHRCLFFFCRRVYSSARRGSTRNSRRSRGAGPSPLF